MLVSNLVVAVVRLEMEGEISLSGVEKPTAVAEPPALGRVASARRGLLHDRRLLQPPAPSDGDGRCVRKHRLGARKVVPGALVPVPIGGQRLEALGPTRANQQL